MTPGHLAQPLLHATPLPGQLELDVIQVGYMRGLILASGTGDAFVDISFTEDPDISSCLALPALQEIQRGLSRYVRERDRIGYIKQFIGEMEQRKDGDVKPLYDVVSGFEARTFLPHPNGIGLLAVHLYHETRRNPSYVH